ncbi:Zn-dependent protease [Hamadaea flava]|uniref:Zn-dependent protease n=1 Tax=Hamadaea flava TaxID=1742688 RepID=A0ABV8LMB1_9ACTN|nr:hypothetical protein [Hamadaea flava]MCP2323887.1 Zn-dependent protease [Hamadaea flava]
MRHRSTFAQFADESGVLLIVAILVAGLAAVRLPAAHPGRSTGAYLIAGLITLAVFGLCAAAHELAHAIAPASGSASAELVAAAAGPLASLGLGGLCGVATAALALSGAGGLTVSVAAYIGLANLVLAAGTLLPGASSDGGRLLRAWIWRTTGDPRRATRGAARTGRAIGFALILGGVVVLVAGAAVAGIWLALTGWFVAAQL